MNERREPREPVVVGVVGAGYVGLTTACCLASFGHRVVCGDLDQDKIECLSQGRPTIFEEGLEDLLRAGLASGQLEFVVGAARAVPEAEVVFLCVPTPQQPDGSADVSALEAAATEIAPHLRYGAIVVNKSTVPVGSAEVVERLIGRSDVSVVSNPEFLREGSAIHDSLNPDRIVVGGRDPAAATRVGALFHSTEAPVIVTDAATAETIKYASNAFLATKLSFINAVANLCEALGADVKDVLLGMGYDHRIGFDYLRPGPGWGGSCLPKDTRALIYIGERAGYDFSILRSAIQANEEQLSSIVSKVRRFAGGDLRERTVAVWGLAFKAGTDDLRSSPALDIVARIASEGARVQAYDPTVSSGDQRVPEGIEIHLDPYGACNGAVVLLVLTEWEEFRWIDLGKVREELAEPRIVDARNLLDLGKIRRYGFSYVGVGQL